MSTVEFFDMLWIVMPLWVRGSLPIPARRLDMADAYIAGRDDL